MDQIQQIPREMSKIIPIFNGDEKLLNLFIRKCEYVIARCRLDGNPEQDLYVYQVITSRLAGRAAQLISERQDIDTWSELKNALEQHFGDPRSEECIAIELETLKMNNGESYLDFCNRIQHVKSTLIAKVNLISDDNLRKSKITIYDSMSMNVFLFNLPEDLLRIVRLKGCNSLEKALSIVLEEVNFMYQYNSKNKMMKSQNISVPKPQPVNPNPFIERSGMKQFFTPTQPQPHFKFGITQNANPNNSFNQQQPKFKFGIPQSRQVKLPLTQPQQSFGYRPQFGQGQPTFGYKPQFNQSQPQFGFKPQFNQGQPQFGYRPPQRQPPQLSTDVSMRTAPPMKPQGFRMNELYSINESANEESSYPYEEQNDECYLNYAGDMEPQEVTEDCENYDTQSQVAENFHVIASDQNLK